MTDRRLRIVVGGYIGLLPAGGITWDYVQYPLGFARLGHDVFYIEDTQLWPIYNAEGQADCSPNVAHLAQVMEWFGFGDRWAYRDAASRQCFGLSEAKIRDICRTADVLVNISCSTVMRDEYHRIPSRILIDSDPMFTQIQYATQVAFTPGESGIRGAVADHTHHFTFGENIGAEDCRIPVCGVEWQPTRQPVCLDQWPVTPPLGDANAAFTTVMNWTAGRPLLFGGESWGQKDVEFERFISLPLWVPDVPLAVAVGQTCGAGAAFPATYVERQGWRVLDPVACAPEWRSYRDFIRGSRGEFSVAKQTYVKARTGWFSCRSACYLAAGRPVVTQDTGWTRYIPSGRGLFAFDTLSEAVAALECVDASPISHGHAAREIAQEFFDSMRVLTSLLVRAGA